MTLHEHRNNTNLKRIKSALRLSNAEVYDIMGRSAYTHSRNYIQGWLRSPTASRHHTHSRSGESERVRLYRPMTDQEFDAFCEALVGWAHERADAATEEEP